MYQNIPYDLSFILVVRIHTSSQRYRLHSTSHFLSGIKYVKRLKVYVNFARPGRKERHILWHFLYAWVAKYFRTYVLNILSNPKIEKFSGLGRAKLFDLDEARELISSSRAQAENCSLLEVFKVIYCSITTATKDSSYKVQISQIDVAKPATPTFAILVQNMSPLSKGIKSPPEGVKNIMDILDTSLSHSKFTDFFDSGAIIDGSKGVCHLNNDKAESTLRANCSANAPSTVFFESFARSCFLFNVDTAIKVVSHISFEGLPSVKCDFDILYAIILERGIEVTPSEISGNKW
ncbi:LOW QUALITY PROTEIN: hypothetical protein Cgig2_023746 [Carnegiea gigantea]|uniref:Uncharacterized protein n=1 Tax=Carnegiea gigantea TaxID=171969 RepID=A0A9Q1GPA4_9CARY|nr:LOW QUALITY PROTEIN: hypothetical protein Cgig2_023746 [Carnegiea gigantea]